MLRLNRVRLSSSSSTKINPKNVHKEGGRLGKQPWQHGNLYNKRRTESASHTRLQRRRVPCRVPADQASPALHHTPGGAVRRGAKKQTQNNKIVGQRTPVVPNTTAVQYAPAHSPHQRRSRGGRQPAKEKERKERRKGEKKRKAQTEAGDNTCLLYTSPSPRD